MKYLFGLFIFSLFAISCSNSSSTGGNNSQNDATMLWTSGITSYYAVNARDTAQNNLDLDIPSGYDTIIRTIVSTNQTFMGKSNVMIYRDSSTRTRKSTLGHMSQDNDGTVWIYNFGEDIWSGYFTGLGVSEIGWVKYMAAPGTNNWTNNFDIGRFVGSDDSYVTYAGSFGADETISLQGTSYTAKHIQQTVSTSTLGYTPFFTIYVDSYLVFKLGMPIKEIVHSYTDWVHTEHEGTTAQMVSRLE